MMRYAGLHRDYCDAVEDPVAAAILTLAEVIADKKDGVGDALTVEEAADYLNVKPQTVYKMCRDNLRHHRVGEGRGTIRIKRRDLERLQR